MKNTFTSFLFIISFLICSRVYCQQADTLSGSLVYGDSLRTYKMYVPAAYTGVEPWPVVIALHGYNLNSNWMFNFTGLNTVADTGHFLVVYPQGLLVPSGVPGSPLPPVGPGWNDDGASVNDDVGFISRLIDELEASFNINPARIYAAGLSNGGGMANRLACELNERIAAAASVSGSLTDLLSCDPGRAVPIVYFNGTNDPLVPLEGMPGVTKSLEEAMAFWSTNNGCDTTPTEVMLPDIVSSDSSTITLKTYVNCDENAEVWLYQVENGGHPWPGIALNSPAFLGNKNEDISASVEMWNFFSRFTHPGLVDGLSYQLPESLPELRIFPNPFSEELTFDFELATPKSIKWRLLNILAQPVSETSHLNLPAGYHSIKWKLSHKHLAEGLYYLQFLVGDQQISRPILYIP